MSEVTARKLIEARLATYAGAHEVYWVNTIEQADITASAGYIVASYRSADAFMAETNGSGGTFRHPGLLIASVFSPRGTGEGAGLTVADTIAALFRGKQDTSGTTKVVYRSPRIRDVGASGDWYQWDVEVPFERDTAFTTS